ncbi:MAG: hypothetical protein HRU15_01490 [Planctomycetes bacterium]|nr:hypothetical protein [Planctomycetota bacterium]
MRSFIICCVFVCCCCSCKHPNRAVANDDIAIAISLNRSWMHKKAGVDFEYVDWEFDPEIDDIEEIAGVLFIPFAYVIHQIFEGIANAIVYSIEAAPKTKFVVYPNDMPEYRQRLYWGINTVYFPANSSGSESYLFIEISGDRVLGCRIPINVDIIKKVVME